MDKLTDRDGQSLDIINENLESLKTIFPEAFTEDGINFEVLRQLLGDAIADGEEKYGLNWFGKKKARQIALMPSLGTLRPCPEESVDWDTTQNIFIEGDNLEVLKLLQKSYANKIKMIYIDPPYNTGNEFIYPDKFQDNLDTYLRYTGQKDDEGFSTSSNSESSGRYHTNWLNMMYPRLKLARSLLRDDGVIFISIDDNESASLRKVCDEIFGEENFIANLIRISSASQNVSHYISIMHDYCLVYCKDKNVDLGKWKTYKNNYEEYQKRAKALINRGLTPDEISSELKELVKYPRFYDFDHYYYCDEIGVYQTVSAGGVSSGNTDSQVIHPKTGRPCTIPQGGWRYKKDTLAEITLTNRWHFGEDETTIPRVKLYLKDYLEQTPKGTNFFDSQKDIHFFKKHNISFDFPKPIEFLIRLIRMIANDGDIILDFFSGSCSTAHAMLDLNNEDKSNRKFIVVQLPEPCDEQSEAFKSGYKTIAEIGKERIRRVGKKIKEENPMFAGDIGFKVFKLDSSNIRAWNPDRNDLEQTLLDHVDHLVEGRSEEDVLYELLLKRGVDLTMPIAKKQITGKTVYSIGFGVLFACLDQEIKSVDVEELAQGIIDWHKELEPASDTLVVFRDSAFANDITKTNMTAILEQNGIKHIRSL